MPNALLPIGLIIFLLGCSPTLPVASNSDPGIFVSQSPTPTSSGQVLPVSARAQIADRPIELEVAKTPEQQAMGLMYRTSLPDNRGMLFEFKPARWVNFWMKNCQISLDMIFLRDGVVTAIQAGAPPCTADPCPTYGPDTIVDQVIELRSGRAAELGVKVGDRIAIDFF
ncbi:MAG: DUF192 domain-containing protein [Tychonema bourrellyi B0820]|uniref:DUF192 domain-containing protein n=1 Tax=Tychonema bourrellyi FEM_GT703 TaxID=2040638 RepID=A0A2G4F4J7_9CYAN|nr:DUF192 domain-containing protein [Tychonema bourrellyi]MDQ2100194.1 DUF192 domain-containing protein [Tychonema bourrellyi B0820]PHX56676.1 hypothetical protein CP500_004060 [Tychonema bourrellyi FEM_GT703]